MLLLVCCYALWGGGMIAMKYAFESFAVLHVVFARVGLAALFYLALLPKWRHLPYQKGDWKYLLLLVMFEPCLFFLCETFSMKFTTASQGGVIAACFPLCTAVAAWIFLKEKLTGRTIVAIILAVIGVAGSSYFAEGDAKASNPLLGNLLMFGAVLSSSGYAVCVRFISRRYSFLSISAIQAIGGSLAFFPALLSAPMPESVTMPALAGLLYMGVGVGILAYLIFPRSGGAQVSGSGHRVAVRQSHSRVHPDFRLCSSGRKAQCAAGGLRGSCAFRRGHFLHGKKGLTGAARLSPCRAREACSRAFSS